MSEKMLELPNRHLRHLETDSLFHLEIPLNDPETVSLFQNVKFVCMGGTASRMENLALHLARELAIERPVGSPLDFSFNNERYSGFKVGPVFCVNHGIGLPSVSIVLHEVFKLLQKAGCCDVTLIRVGTCGGIGISLGTVVISTGSLTAGMKPYYRTSSMGKSLKLPTTADPELVNGIYSCHTADDDFQVLRGKTYCTEDFYQGQGRLDGSFCDFNHDDKMDFLRQLSDNGVVNIEMESAAVLAMSAKVGIRAAVVCSVIVDRMKGDLPSMSKMDNAVYQNNAIKLISRYIKQQLSK